LRIGARNSSTHPTGQRACRRPANFIVAGHPAIQQCLQRVDAIDAALQEEQEARIAIEQLRQQLAAVAEGTDDLDALLPL
jgi:ABC-type hemin transport system substrate-binding protein